MNKFSVLFSLVVLGFLSCKKDGTASDKPEIKFNPSVYKVAEDVPGGLARVVIYLSDAFDEAVTIDYTTLDSTAVSGVNYTATASGTVTFNRGEKSKALTIPVLHDTVSKEDLFFSIRFSNPVNAVLTANRITVKIINVDYGNLTWSDEFNDASLNSDWWNYEQGNNNGWGNNELEVYTNQSANVHLDSGYLHITALNPSPNSYTSARLTTLGKKEFTYGKMVIRAKMPYGKGIWPALWMLGSNISSVSWPKCGEIDMMEYLGHQTSTVYGTLHWDENGHKYLGGNKTLSSGTFSDDFHIFTLVWTPGRFRWLVDGIQYYELDRNEVAQFPFDLPEFFIFNVAVGGNWPGNPDGTTVFPQHMIVDYIRVYQ
jgi:hypothetical protein